MLATFRIESTGVAVVCFLFQASVDSTKRVFVYDQGEGIWSY